MRLSLTDFRSKLADGQALIGPFMKTGDAAFVEIAGYSGFDFVILDMEHGPTDINGLQNLIRAAQIGGVLPIVRVPDHSETVIAKALDVGAVGIQVPQVITPEDVKKIIRASRYAPLGERGVCRFVRAAGYSSIDRYQYFKQANETALIIQLEGAEAIQNIDEILKIDGIDIIFIGPYDLSQSLGVPGQIHHPEVEQKMIDIVRKARNAGRYIGTFVDNIKDAQKWQLKGVQYLSYSVDVGLFFEYCHYIVNQLKSIEAGRVDCENTEDRDLCC